MATKSSLFLSSVLLIFSYSIFWTKADYFRAHLFLLLVWCVSKTFHNSFIIAAAVEVLTLTFNLSFKFILINWKLVALFRKWHKNAIVKDRLQFKELAIWDISTWFTLANKCNWSDVFSYVLYQSDYVLVSARFRFEYESLVLSESKLGNWLEIWIFNKLLSQFQTMST